MILMIRPLKDHHAIQALHTLFSFVFPHLLLAIPDMNWVVHLARLGRQSYSRRFRGDAMDGGVIVLFC